MMIPSMPITKQKYAYYLGTVLLTSMGKILQDLVFNHVRLAVGHMQLPMIEYV